MNRLEDFIESMNEALPPRTNWTVFYLRSADATETAEMLQELFPSSSVSSSTSSNSRSPGPLGGLTSGLSSIGSSLMDMTGLSSLGTTSQSLRIIADVRSNSLFVTGPSFLVNEVEQMLKILDAAELPESLRARIPRLIDVRFADVEEVAGIVRDVYKDYLEPVGKLFRQ